MLGAPGEDSAGDTAGAAYVFERAVYEDAKPGVGGGGPVWTQLAKLTADDAAAQDHFGYSVAVSTDTSLPVQYAVNDQGYQAYQFNPTKSGSSTHFQMSEIEFQGTDGAVIDLSDCTATETGGTSAGSEPPSKMIDGNSATKWCTIISSSVADLVLVIACSTPKTVARVRWATANDVSSHLTPTCAADNFLLADAEQRSAPVGSVWWRECYRAVDRAAGSDHRLSGNCCTEHILRVD